MNTRNKSILLTTLKPGISYLLKWSLLSLCLGLTAGSASALFLHSLEWVTALRENHLWIISLLPLAGLGIGMLYHYTGKEIESGNNLLLSNIYHPKEILHFKMAPWIYICTLLTHLFGGSAGREGTALQMSGALADQFTRPFRLSSDDRKILLTAAVSAGFGSVFGTPLAGALFGLEVSRKGKIRYDALFPASASSFLADFVTRLWQTPHTQYHIPILPEISGAHILYACIAGIAFGLTARIFSQLMHSLSHQFKSTMPFPPLRPFVGGIIVAFSVWALDTSKYIGLGIPSILQSFEHPIPVYDFALKMVLTILTLSSGFKGGEVTPLFFIGATLGNALSYFLPLPIGLLSGMGFVAVFAGATNTPIACTFMAMELFGPACGLYAGIVCVFAYLTSGHNGIYTKQILPLPKYKFWSSKNLISIEDQKKLRQQSRKKCDASQTHDPN
jgi:H+/Cl- antiporter ClcA